MMEVSVNSDFTNSALNTVSLQKPVQNEVEDGELLEETNIVVTEEEKKILRAKRFGPVSKDSRLNIKDPKLQRLCKRMKVNDETRMEALHLHGTDNMKTEDVFALFSEDDTPASIEWLTDKTCNAVWLDQESCAKALKNVSVRIKGQHPDESDDSEEEYINKEDIRCALPPGGVWRRSHATQLAPNLLVRYALYSDRRGNKPIHLQYNDPLRRHFVFLDEGDEVARKSRPDTGNPWGDIAREWSAYEMRSAAKKYDERLLVRDARDLISKGGRIPPPIVVAGGGGGGGGPIRAKKWSSVQYRDEDDPALINSHDRILSGRKMQADIEEKKILSKRLKLRSDRSSPSGIDLRQRLSKKRKQQYYDDDFSDEEESDEIKSYKHEKSRKKRNHVEESWTRGESEDSDSEERSHQSSSSEDLRRKLRKSSTEPISIVAPKKTSTVLTQNTKKFVPDTPLQIEIDNDIYIERMKRYH